MFLVDVEVAQDKLLLKPSDDILDELPFELFRRRCCWQVKAMLFDALAHWKHFTQWFNWLFKCNHFEMPSDCGQDNLRGFLVTIQQEVELLLWWRIMKVKVLISRIVKISLICYLSHLKEKLYFWRLLLDRVKRSQNVVQLRRTLVAGHKVFCWRLVVPDGRQVFDGGLGLSLAKYLARLMHNPMVWFSLDHKRRTALSCVILAI